MKSVICYLLINRIPKLPKLALESALQNTEADIYVGYLKESDLCDLPVNKRIHFVNLSDQAFQKNLIPSTVDYVSFDEDFFFQLVQLKWDLFNLVLSETKADFLVYLDLDVVVLKNLVAEFERTFESLPDIDVLVQDFTNDPSIPRLCMGVFALRRSDFSVKLLQRCSELHQKTLSVNPRFGDDDVISAVYADKDLKSSFLRLPQQSFPVGNLVNLFLPFSPLRGLRPPKPFVFHSNFVVGTRKKYFLLKLIYDERKFSKNIQLIQAYFYVFREVLIRKFRLLVSKTIRAYRGK